METYTVIYDGKGQPTYGIVLARQPSGERVIAHVAAEAAQTLQFLTDGSCEPVGARGRTERRGDKLHWRAGTS